MKEPDAVMKQYELPSLMITIQGNVNNKIECKIIHWKTKRIIYPDAKL